MATVIVSILTRPEGRVLPGDSRQPDKGQSVSILTRPEGRVLHGHQFSSLLIS